MHNRQAERSKRKIFLRIFGALTIVFLIWVIFFFPRSQNQAPVSDSTDTLAHNDEVTIPAEVSDFVTFVELSSDTVTAEETNEYASMGIEQLSITLESFIQRNAKNYHSMTSRTDELKNIAKELEKDKNDSNSEKAKNAFLIAADILGTIQGMEESDIKAKAEQIKENLDLEQQLEQVKNCFITFADVFKEMTGIETKVCCNPPRFFKSLFV